MLPADAGALAKLVPKIATIPPGAIVFLTKLAPFKTPVGWKDGAVPVGGG
jgi:hypothetical protein